MIIMMIIQVPGRLRQPLPQQDALGRREGGLGDKYYTPAVIIITISNIYNSTTICSSMY